MPSSQPSISSQPTVSVEPTAAPTTESPTDPVVSSALLLDSASRLVDVETETASSSSSFGMSSNLAIIGTVATILVSIM